MKVDESVEAIRKRILFSVDYYRKFPIPYAPVATEDIKGTLEDSLVLLKVLDEMAAKIEDLSAMLEKEFDYNEELIIKNSKLEEELEK